MAALTKMADIVSAVLNAKGGEEFEVADGEYGKLSLKDTSFLTAPVTFRAKNKHEAVLTGFELVGTDKLVLDGFMVDYAFAPTHAEHHVIGKVHQANDITLRNILFDGDLVEGTGTFRDGYGNGKALDIKTCAGVTVEGTEFRDFHRGVVMSAVKDVELRALNIHHLRSDGIDFGTVTDGLLIEDTWIHDFVRAPESSDHPDAIQGMANSATAGSKNITIRDNVIDMGLGNFTQSIFMRCETVDQAWEALQKRTFTSSFDENKAYADFWALHEAVAYRNVLIENNLIVNGHSHGITVGEAIGLTIRGNTLLRQRHLTGTGVTRPRINVNERSNDVLIELNVGPAFPISNPDRIVRNNVIVSAEAAEQSYTNLDPVDGQHRPLVIPGGLVDRAKAGASITYAAPEPVPVDPMAEFKAEIARLVEALGATQTRNAELIDTNTALTSENARLDKALVDAATLIQNARDGL